MSRSYKKGWYHQWACGKDKPFRQMYNRARRARDHQILKECEKEYRDLDNLFHPYTELSSCYGDICNVDEWVSAPEYVEGREEEYQPIPDMNACIGCMWSENCWDKHKFVDMWSPSPDEKFVNSRVDYSICYADKWGWPSDGGVYYQGNKQDCRKEIDDDVFGLDYSGRNIWERYVSNRKHLAGKNVKYSYLSRWDWFDLLFLEGKIPLSFYGPKDFMDWFRAHNEEIVDLYWKSKLRKE